LSYFIILCSYPLFSDIFINDLFFDDVLENVDMARKCGVQAYHLQRGNGEDLLVIERLLM
ncbi:hypothetical protein, partial [Photobacterium sp. DNB22_13_2]